MAPWDPGSQYVNPCLSPCLGGWTGPGDSLLRLEYSSSHFCDSVAKDGDFYLAG